MGDEHPTREAHQNGPVALAWPSKDPDLFVWGHRGAPRLAPENTVPGFRLALARGVDGVECDVQRTADGEVVVLHDATLERTTSGRGWIGAWRWKEVAALCTRAPDGSWSEARVPRLADVLEAVPPPTPVLIEFKNGPYYDDGLVEAVVGIVDSQRARSRVMFSSFDQFALARAAELAPEVPRALAWGMGRLVRPWETGRAGGSDVLHPHLQSVPGGDVQRMQEHGCSVALWGLRAADDVRLARQLGADAVFVDDPAWVGR